MCINDVDGVLQSHVSFNVQIKQLLHAQPQLPPHPRRACTRFALILNRIVIPSRSMCRISDLKSLLSSLSARHCEQWAIAASFISFNCSRFGDLTYIFLALESQKLDQAATPSKQASSSQSKKLIQVAHALSKLNWVSLLFFNLFRRVKMHAHCDRGLIMHRNRLKHGATRSSETTFIAQLDSWHHSHDAHKHTHWCVQPV